MFTFKIQTRPVETGAGGEGLGDWSPLQSFAKSYFYQLKKDSVEWKIVQSYKTSWNSSKVIVIYNTLLISKPEMVYLVSNELPEIF